MIVIETGTGKSRFFRDIIEYLDYTENGFQNIIADDLGSSFDPVLSNVQKYQDEYFNIDLPDLPEVPDIPEGFQAEE